MKAILICPTERKNVAALAENIPLATVPILGKMLVEYWLEHLATLGAKEVLILAADRPEQVRALVGDGARWGLRMVVIPEIRELTAAEARKKYRNGAAAGWLPAPDDARLMDSLPRFPEIPMFISYADWFTATMQWLPHAATPDRIGVRQIKPGVWVGLHTQVSPDAKLRAPCWIGENVRVGCGAVVGPMAVIEDKALIQPGAKIFRSIVGPQTFVGKHTDVGRSIAWGGTLASWKLDSCLKVSDAFLLCPLAPRQPVFSPVHLPARAAALAVLLLTLPLAVLAILKAKLRGLPALRLQIAVRPGIDDGISSFGRRLVYCELAGVSGWFRRWPQLWNIAVGHFRWIGNRPVNPRRAAKWSNEFERLWLAAPVGLISLADVEGCNDFSSAEAHAYASYYAAQSSRRLDWAILRQAVFLFAFGISYPQAREQIARAFGRKVVEEGHAS
jgi:hypothetical protein